MLPDSINYPVQITGLGIMKVWELVDSKISIWECYDDDFVIPIEWH